MASLVVADLPMSSHEGDVVELFSQFGKLIQVKTWKTATSTSAMVNYSNFEDARVAKSHLDGYIHMGCRIRVELMSATVESPKNAQINSIYVRFSAHRVRPITFESLFPIFTPFGTVTEISVKDSTVDPRTGRQSGLAFVHFDSSPEGLQCALRAIQSLDGATVDGIHIKAEPSRNLTRQFQDMRQAPPPPPPLQQQQGYAPAYLHQPPQQQQPQQYPTAMPYQTRAQMPNPYGLSISVPQQRDFGLMSLPLPPPQAMPSPMSMSMSSQSMQPMPLQMPAQYPQQQPPFQQPPSFQQQQPPYHQQPQYQQQLGAQPAIPNAQPQGFWQRPQPLLNVNAPSWQQGYSPRYEYPHTPSAYLPTASPSHYANPSPRSRSISASRSGTCSDASTPSHATSATNGSASSLLALGQLGTLLEESASDPNYGLTSQPR